MTDDAWEVAVLHFRAVVTGPPALVGELRAARPSWPLDGAHADVATFQVRAADPNRDTWQIEVDGRPSGSILQRADVVPSLDRAINRAAVDTLGARYALLHAGALAYRGVGCVLPAPSGSGKTTLTAGLAAAGFACFSDEVAVLDPASTRLLPFPKALGVKAGARRVLARAYPALIDGLPRRRIDGRALWLLPPPPAARPTGPVLVRALVVPRYVPRGHTSLIPIQPSEAFAEALRQLAGSDQHATRNVRTLAAVVHGAACYRLTIGRLDGAVRLLTQALDDLAG